MKFRYFVPDDGETIEDAEIVTESRYVDGMFVEVENFTDNPETAAEAAAGAYQIYSEWHDGARTFAVVDEKNNVTHVEVTLEYEPVFTGRTIENK